MLLGFVLLFGYALVVWLVFFKFKWLKFSIAWGFFSTFFALHLMLIFLIGLRFVTPLATEARVIQHTIQLIPRLPEPTLVTAVLVEPNVAVKKGQPLFQFDRRPYEYKVKQLEAQLAKAKLAKAKQDVPVLRADTQINNQKIAKLRADLNYAKYQLKLSTDLARQGAGPQEDAQKWTSQVAANEAGIKEAQAEEARARLRYTSDIGGVNTTVAAIQAELDLARYYLDNTLMVAPEDGYVMNLQVRPGMVAGEVRVGAIASFIVDSGRYLLTNYFQENLKYVKPGQEVEIALDLYPGQIFKGKVQAIWQGSGQGQLLPSGTLLNFNYVPTEIPQGQFAVAIRIEGGLCSRSAPKAARRSTPTRRVPSPSCAGSASADTHGSTSSIRSPADARRCPHRVGGARRLCAEGPADAHRGGRTGAAEGSSHPPTWKADPGASAVVDDWLKSFNAPALDAIVAEAIANNLDLRQAAEGVRIAQQNVVVAGAQLMPQVDGVLGADATRNRDQDKNYYSTLAYDGVAWELDVWGRLRAQRAAAGAGFEASALDYAYARQSLAALVAKSWYLVIKTSQLVALGEQTVKVFSELLELVTIRRSAGRDPDLDVVDTRAKLETAQSELEAAREA